jgi:hypothetical protein
MNDQLAGMRGSTAYPYPNKVVNEKASCKLSGKIHKNFVDEYTWA